MLRTIAEIGFGVLAAAVFNAVYTSTHGEEFYGSSAHGAFVPGARRLIENVAIPNATLFTVPIVVSRPRLRS